ncbi:MAG: transposase [Gammaproteobacteria bacterium]
MARPLRLEYAGALYHVTSRGDRREAIYEDDDDRLRWLVVIAEVCERFNWRVHAYCLMDNHYHLVLETVDGNLSKGMRQLNGVYTQYYNRRHGRSGHVFQGRYKAVHVDREAYLLELCRYVVLNPVRAGMVNDVGDWPWSNYQAMVGKSAPLSWLATDWVLSHFSGRRGQARAKYVDFVREGVGLPSIWTELKQQVFLGDEAFINQHMKAIDNKDGIEDIPRLQRRAAAKSLRYFSESNRDQREAIKQAFRTGAYTMKEIGEYFGMHYSTISRIINRGA